MLLGHDDVLRGSVRDVDDLVEGQGGGGGGHEVAPVKHGGARGEVVPGLRVEGRGLRVEG